MADLNDFRAALEQMRQEVLNQMPAIVAGMSLTAKALAERNMVSKGFGASYSDLKIPNFFLTGKDINNAGKKYQKDNGKPKGTGVNWKGFREAQGLQTAFVDLHYSNKMFQAVAVVKQERAGDTFRAYLGATNAQAVKELNWNFERYGDYIMLSLEAPDKDLIENFGAEQINNILKIFLQ